jgi:hypothetical protein
VLGSGDADGVPPVPASRPALRGHFGPTRPSCCHFILWVVEDFERLRRDLTCAIKRTFAARRGGPTITTRNSADRESTSVTPFGIRPTSGDDPGTAAPRLPNGPVAESQLCRPESGPDGLRRHFHGFEAAWC